MLPRIAVIQTDSVARLGENSHRSINNPANIKIAAAIAADFDSIIIADGIAKAKVIAA